MFHSRSPLALPSLLGACLIVSAIAEPVEPVAQNLEVLGAITDLHLHFHKQHDLEFRILESDGSATVALNPVALYLVVTNNEPGPDGISLVGSLPGVSSVTSVKFLDDLNQILILAKFDEMDESGENIVQVEGAIRITIPFANGALTGKVDAKREVVEGCAG